MSKSVVVALSIAWFLVGLSFTVNAQPPAQKAQADGEAAAAPSPLDRRVDVDFAGAHLQDVIDKLKTDFDLNVRLDRRALDDAGIPWKKEAALKTHRQRMERAAGQLAESLASAGVLLPQDAPTLKAIRELPYPGVNVTADGIALRSVLHHALAEINRDLVFTLRGDVVLITTKDAEESGHLTTRVYPVGDLTLVQDEGPKALFEPALDAGGSPYDVDTLIDVVTSIIDPVSWEEVGGPGAIEPHGQTIIVSQTQRNHEMLRVLLDELRVLKKQDAEKKAEAALAVELPALAAGHEKISTALAAPVELKFEQTPLWEALTAIAKEHALPLRLDRAALAEIGISPYAPVTVDIPKDELHAGLNELLASVDDSLGFHVDHEMLVVTSRERLEEALRIVVYPARDLTEDGAFYDGLLDNISSSIRPETWEDVGGPGAQEPWPRTPALVISQTDEVHRKVADLLAQLREVNALRPKDDPAEPIKRKEDGEYSTVVYRLWQPWDEKAQIPEAEVVKLLQEMIEPESWKADEVFVRTLPSRLIIRQKRDLHRQIYQSLIDLAILKPEPIINPGPFTLGGGLGGDAGLGGGGFGGGFGGGGALGGATPGGFGGGSFGGGGVGGLPPAK